MSKTLGVSEANLEELARAFAVSDAMLSMILAAAEQFKAQNNMINPETIITFIHTHRSTILEANHD